MGTMGGLTRFKDGKWTIYQGGGRLSKKFISAINEDDEGLIVTTADTLALRVHDGRVSPFTLRGQMTPLSVPGNYTFSIYRDGAARFGSLRSRGCSSSRLENLLPARCKSRLTSRSPRSQTIIAEVFGWAAEFPESPVFASAMAG